MSSLYMYAHTSVAQSGAARTIVVEVRLGELVAPGTRELHVYAIPTTTECTVYV